VGRPALRRRSDKKNYRLVGDEWKFSQITTRLQHQLLFGEDGKLINIRRQPDTDMF
jgi:hypothetical protein